ncbi:hypothetical protein DKT68_08040 [Micromonospora acroterricola]|uniref:Uncharacterized protein n=1 Tax=Micromonospora acroterricola TaxID=2202421 RepID=A0A317D943_9ACTN|nr:hypothetical protein DKT68_08040 [Micromonospora acroterricola]
MQMLLSTCQRPADVEPLVTSGVRLWPTGAEMRAFTPPIRAERPAASRRERHGRMGTPPGGSTELETPVIHRAGAVQRRTAVSEVSR